MGYRSSGRNGTDCQIPYEGIPELYAPYRSSLDVANSGPVYHIVTPRQKNTPLSKVPFKLEVLWPDDATPADDQQRRDAYARVLQRTDTFNRDVKTLAPELRGSMVESKAYLIP